MRMIDDLKEGLYWEMTRRAEDREGWSIWILWNCPGTKDLR